MNRIISIILAMTVTAMAAGARYNRVFSNIPVSDALSILVRENPELDINFIYDDLDKYSISATVSADTPLEAVKQIVAGCPVSVVMDGKSLYVEALQRGRFRYTGRAVSEKGEAVPFATVMLLSPGDSLVITHGRANDNGVFSLPCDRREVIAKVTCIGYRPALVKTDGFEIGDVTMKVLPVELKNVTATPDARHFAGDRTVYLPTKREKNVASGGVELLRFMSIPSLVVGLKDDKLSTLSGEGISTFIDYQPASAEELAQMRTQDVRRVEILDYPTDPRFQGALHAVNFIMVKYEYGGYTKLRATRQFVRNYGSYGINSKFAFRKMTYDIAAGHTRHRDTRSGTNQTAVFGFADGDITRRSATEENLSKTLSSFASFRAKYETDKTVLSNFFSVKATRQPNSSSTDLTSYTPQSFPDSKSVFHRKSTEVSPSWQGVYQFTLPHSAMLSINTGATYSHNKSYSEYSEEEALAINDVREKAWDMYLTANLRKKLGNQSISFRTRIATTGNRLDYEGTLPARIRHNRTDFNLNVRGNLALGKFWIDPSVNFFYSHVKFTGADYNEPLWSYFIPGGFNFNQKHQLSFSTEMSNWTIPVTERSPNIVVRNRLLAVKGNPELKSWLFNAFNLQYNYTPRRNFYLNAFAQLHHHSRPMDAEFIPTEIDGKQMMLQTWIKEGSFTHLTYGLGATLRLFDNSLTIGATASLNNARRTGYRKYSRFFAAGGASAQYFFGNFYTYLSYETRQLSVTPTVHGRRNPYYFVLGSGWGNNGWSVSLQLRNPFQSSWKSSTLTDIYRNYRTEATTFSDGYHRHIQLSITYSFSYGKKTKSDDIGQGSSVRSGIVR